MHPLTNVGVLIFKIVMSGYLILLLGGLQGIILAILIFSKTKNAAKKYLGSFVLLLGLGSLLDNSFSQLNEDLFVILWSANSFLFAPLLFLYAVRLTKSFDFTFKIAGNHFTVFLLMKVAVVSFHFSGSNETFWVQLLGVLLNFFLVFYNLFYGFLTLRHVSKESKRLKTKSKWLKAITIIFISYGVILLGRRIISDIVGWELLLIDDYIYTGVAIILYWMSFKIIQQPKLIFEGEKYTKSGLTTDDIQLYGSKIRNYLETSKAFKSSDFNLSELSSELNIPKHQMSQVLTEFFGVSFYQLIQKYRVQEVQKLMVSNQYKHLSLLGIANECGFQSKSAFNKAFKEIVGVTPSKYLQKK